MFDKSIFQASIKPSINLYLWKHLLFTIYLMENYGIR
jgi:hypothetical protein